MVQAGGKRLRPAFCHWGFVGAGGNAEDQRVVDVGAAFELMHAFALFHDDVMDDAATRRGAPTTHAVYAREHRAAGWTGESRRFGEGVAILIGDLAFVLSDELSIGVPDAAWRMWNELRTELNVGQFLDILGSVRRERRLEKAERIARYKSGKYTIERPLHLGALLAAPDRADTLLPQLSTFGLPLGDAFQMRDDVIGVFGDSAQTGKPVGGDLIEGKPTPLLARAVALASPTQQAMLDRVGADGLEADGVSAIQQVIVDTGALGRARGGDRPLGGRRHRRARGHRSRRHRGRRVGGARHYVGGPRALAQLATWRRTMPHMCSRLGGRSRCRRTSGMVAGERVFRGRQPWFRAHVAGRSRRRLR